MLLLFAAMALTDVQQAQHDRTEWAIYQRLQTDKEAIADMWRPNNRLLADYRKAHGCYLRFHLYRATDCNPELAAVDLDLGYLQIAQTKSRCGH
jgi:hypothetical protein